MEIENNNNGNGINNGANNGANNDDDDFNKMLDELTFNMATTGMKTREQRLQEEFEILFNQDESIRPPGWVFRNKNDDNNFIKVDGEIILEGLLKGPENSFYENLEFLFEIIIPVDYPDRPPSVKPMTKIYHPNITYKIGLNILDSDWSNKLSLYTVCFAIAFLLYDPLLDTEGEGIHPLNSSIANEMKNDPDEFKRKIVEHYNSQ